MRESIRKWTTMPEMKNMNISEEIEQYNKINYCKYNMLILYIFYI